METVRDPWTSTSTSPFCAEFNSVAKYFLKRQKTKSFLLYKGRAGALVGLLLLGDGKRVETIFSCTLAASILRFSVKAPAVCRATYHMLQHIDTLYVIYNVICKWAVYSAVCSLTAVPSNTNLGTKISDVKSGTDLCDWGCSDYHGNHC